ncbi:hypothetical protein AGOR_G00130330 [Albula goreensis]|uniref:Nuclear speckle splicing regulatory protein 1 n=1 Tax=Albula goreensis TaxID=1534307 RepID=A0A8T3DD67_9TELE|nr:hypothetical protein AGOR_G00130330 [Albula goreensis]
MKMAVPGKQYGLILLKKSATKSTTVARPSVFEEDSDDEISVGESLQKEAAKKKSMKQTRLEMQKALEQDSSVYEYDSVYDDIHKKDERSKPLAHSDNRKPKYISQLLHAVEERKKEQERREERKIQKERETEGEQFKDKEAFVTSAYRQKLLERQAEAEAQRKEAALEAALDVKKQKDLSGFYRHLLSQTVGEDREPAADATPASQRPSPCGPAHSQSDGKAKQDRRPEACSSSHSKRQYRDRSPSCKFAKRSSDQTVSSARERFLARQMARSSSAKTYIEKEED